MDDRIISLIAIGFLLFIVWASARIWLMDERIIPNPETQEEKDLRLIARRYGA